MGGVGDVALTVPDGEVGGAGVEQAGDVELEGKGVRRDVGALAVVAVCGERVDLTGAEWCGASADALVGAGVEESAGFDGGVDAAFAGALGGVDEADTAGAETDGDDRAAAAQRVRNMVDMGPSFVSEVVRPVGRTGRSTAITSSAAC